MLKLAKQEKKEHSKNCYTQQHKYFTFLYAVFH